MRLLSIVGRVDPLKPHSDSRLPLYLARVPAGHPAAIGLDVDTVVSLGELLAVTPSSYLIRVEGTSMVGAGIAPGDFLVVDREAAPRDGQVVVAEVDGELTVKHVRRCGSRVALLPSNEAFETIEVGPGSAFEVWGVVTFVLHDVRQPSSR